MKHEKSPSSGPMCHGKGRKANKGHNFWTIVRTYYSKRSSSTLWIHGMPRSINLLNLLTVFAHIAGPLSRNNPGATTEVATARMIGHHLKHCQTPSKIINGLKLLRASKSPAEHVGKLDVARLHITRNTPFTGSAELVILSQSNRCLCGQLRSYISQEFANFKSQ